MYTGPLIFLICALILLTTWILTCIYLIRKRIKRHEVKQGAIISPVVVTSATHTAPGGYPVTTQMPPPGGMPYGQPYPPPPQTNMTVTHTSMPMPHGQPPPTGFQPHVAPYPPPMDAQPAFNSAANMNPPSYESAVAGANYEKQAPYNPSYAQ